MTLSQLAAALKEDNLIQVTQGASVVLSFYSKGYSSIDATLGAKNVTEITLTKTNTGVRLDVVVEE